MAKYRVYFKQDMFGHIDIEAPTKAKAKAEAVILANDCYDLELDDDGAGADWEYQFIDKIDDDPIPYPTGEGEIQNI